jgi:hypothetical protein
VLPHTDAFLAALLGALREDTGAYRWESHPLSMRRASSWGSTSRWRICWRGSAVNTVGDIKQPRWSLQASASVSRTEGSALPLAWG